MTNNQTDILKRAFLEVETQQTAAYDSLPASSSVHSEAFEKRMDKLTRYRGKAYWKYTNTIKKRAAVILVAVMILFAASMSVSAVREPVVSFFIKVYEAFTGFFVEDNTVNAPTTIEHEYQIVQLPVGYKISEQSKSDINIQTIFTNDADRIIFSQVVISTTDIKIDTEDTSYSVETIEGMQVYCLNKKGSQIIIWTTQEYLFSIVCSDSLTLEDVAAMIKNIK